MPATFPSHAAAVLPLKLVRPRWFDGVALVVGSTAPDLSYPLHPLGVLLFTHRWISLLWWTLPVTVVLSAIVRWAAPAVAARLPDGKWFALRDYGVLGAYRPRWWITATSAIIGGATHIFWDGFTHPPSGGWFVAEFPVMTHEAVFGQPWWQLVQWISTVAGGAAALAMAVHIGRRRLLRRWHGLPPQVQTGPVPFWVTTAAIGIAGTVVTFVESGQIYVQGAQLLLVWSAALAGGGWLSTVRPAVRRTIPRRFGVQRKGNR